MEHAIGTYITLEVVEGKEDSCEGCFFRQLNSPNCYMTMECAEHHRADHKKVIYKKLVNAEDKEKFFSKDNSLWSGKYSDVPALQAAYKKGSEDGFFTALSIVVFGNIRRALSVTRIKKKHQKTFKTALFVKKLRELGK